MQQTNNKLESERFASPQIFKINGNHQMTQNHRRLSANRGEGQEEKKMDNEIAKENRRMYKANKDQQQQILQHNKQIFHGSEMYSLKQPENICEQMRIRVRDRDNSAISSTIPQNRHEDSIFSNEITNGMQQLDNLEKYKKKKQINEPNQISQKPNQPIQLASNKIPQSQSSSVFESNQGKSTEFAAKDTLNQHSQQKDIRITREQLLRLPILDNSSSLSQSNIFIKKSGFQASSNSQSTTPTNSMMAPQENNNKRKPQNIPLNIYLNKKGNQESNSILNKNSGFPKQNTQFFDQNPQELSQILQKYHQIPSARQLESRQSNNEKDQGFSQRLTQSQLNQRPPSDQPSNYLSNNSFQNSNRDQFDKNNHNQSQQIPSSSNTQLRYESLQLNSRLKQTQSGHINPALQSNLSVKSPFPQINSARGYDSSTIRKAYLKQNNQTPEIARKPDFQEPKLNGFFSEVAKPPNDSSLPSKGFFFDQKGQTKTFEIIFAAKTRAGQYSPNLRKINQDQSITIPAFLTDRSCSFFGVCDGHGEYGHVVSSFVKKSLPKAVTKQMKQQENQQKEDTNLQTILTKAFQNVSQDLLASKIETYLSGTTAVAVLIRENKLWCANCGDSRALLGRQIGRGTKSEWKSIPLSEDHKPEIPREKKRVLEHGGRVEQGIDGNGIGTGIYRVWNQAMEAPGLAMSRSLGDKSGREVGVISEPEIFELILKEEDRFIVIASDGVWEFLSNEEIIKIVIPYYRDLDPNGAADAVIKQSVLSWKRNDDNAIDDITCVVIFFRSTYYKKCLGQQERRNLGRSGFSREEEGVVGNSNTNGQARGGQEARKPSNPWWRRAINGTRLLRFGDEEIEKKYYEDEYLRVMQMLNYQMYLGALISVVLVIMAFVASEYALLLGATAVVLIIPILTLSLAKKFPYKVNWLLSWNNIAWCILIGAVYIWRDGSLIQKCGQSGYFESSSVTDTTQASCSHIFILGGGFYALHVALLIGTNLFANIATFAVINAVYVLSILPSIPYLVCFFIVPPVVVGMTGFAKEKNIRLYYELINKYYIWYHIANNVLPQKIIVTKAATPNATGTSREGAYQFVKANRRARKEFGINSTEQLQQFISQVELKQETHQSVPAYPDDNATQNLAAGGRMDSLHSKSLGIISQFSKKSFTSRQSQLQGISGVSGNRPQARLIPLDLLMKREIRRQHSNNDANNQQNQVDQQSSNINNLPGMHYISHSPANIDGKQSQPQQFVGTGNINTPTQDQGAMFMRNKKRSLFQGEDPGLQSMANPSQKHRGISSGQRSSYVRRLKQEKYKCVMKREGTTAEERGRFSLTLISYSKDEQYQLLMIEDDQNNIEREQALEEQIVLYKGLSMNFGNIMMSEENLLLFYLQQMRQNQPLQKKFSDFMADAFCLNAGVTNRISSFIEFFNFEAQKQELNPRQFSLKKLLRDTASSLDFRIKQNQIQIVFSNDAPPELDLLFNDDKRIKHVLYYLLADCVQHSQKTQIIISTSSGVAEQGDQGDKALQGTIKVTIRDSSTRKYKNNKNNDYFFATNNLKKIIRNKSQSYSDIELSVCKQLLGLVGPQTNIFYMSEDSTNSNKVSFYIYADLLQEGINIDGLTVEGLEAAKEEVYQDEDEQVDDEEEEEEENGGFQQQIQNSDDDTYKNNQSPERPLAKQADQTLNNAGHSSNQNPSSSIYLGHNLEQQQSKTLPPQQQPQQQQQLSSGLLLSTQHQQQQQPQQLQPQQGQWQRSSSSHSNDKQGIPGTSQAQILQQQLIQFSSSQIPAQSNNAGGMTAGQPSLNSQPLLGQLPVYSTTSALVGILPQSTSQFSLSMSNNHLEKYQAQTQPDRKVINPDTQRKSTSQLFDESDQVDDENPISDLFVKDLSLTSVKFKREISRQMSLKTNLFKVSFDDIETNTKISLAKIGNHPFSSSQSGLLTQTLQLSNVKGTSKSVVNNNL